MSQPKKEFEVHTNNFQRKIMRNEFNSKIRKKSPNVPRKKGTVYDRIQEEMAAGGPVLTMTKEEHAAIMKAGHDKDGNFKKGNKCNKILREKLRMKRLIEEKLELAFDADQELETLKELLESESDAVRHNAVKTILAYRYGNPKTIIDAKITNPTEDKKEIPEELLALLGGLGVKKSEIDGANEDNDSGDTAE